LYALEKIAIVLPTYKVIRGIIFATDSLHRVAACDSGVQISVALQCGCVVFSAIEMPCLGVCETFQFEYLSGLSRTQEGFIPYRFLFCRGPLGLDAARRLRRNGYMSHRLDLGSPGLSHPLHFYYLHHFSDLSPFNSRTKVSPINRRDLRM
jgi:hypothetical protein